MLWGSTGSNDMKTKFKIGFGIAVLCYTAQHAAYAAESPLQWKNEAGTAEFKVGAALRFNHRYESWDGPNRGLGKLNFDIFRVDLKGKYDDFSLNSSFVLQDQQYTSIEKAFIGYKLNDQNQLDFGLVYKPFAIYPYPQNGWTYHIPFFLGYGNNIAPGINWNYHDQDWDMSLGYYPRMLPTDLRYSPESATYDDLTEKAFPFQQGYQNEKRHQLNARLVKKLDNDLGKHELGFSGAVSQLHNTLTDDDGKYYAVGLHANSNIQRWNIQGSVIHYQYDAKNPMGVESDLTLMGANGLTPAYFIASEATVSSFNVAYTLPIKDMGKLKALRFYNDYSYMDKKRSDWAGSQMNTTGMMVIASPFMLWADYTLGKNANIIGGASNSTGFSSTNSINSDKWLHRVNLNIGFSF